MKKKDQKGLNEFEKIAGISFNNIDLLKQAFTHRSYINELTGSDKKDEDGVGNNERLEFLGDAVLELIVTDHLFHKYPNKKEGELTSYRAAIVNTNSLSAAAKRLEMEDFLRLSLGEARDTGRARDKILADAFEALIGAVYLDSGYENADYLITRHLLPYLEEIIENELWYDSKSKLQERVQDKMGLTPYYQVIEEKGPDHDKVFTVAVYFGSEEIERGVGKSKQEAEQNAAFNALNMEERNDNN